MTDVGLASPFLVGRDALALDPSDDARLARLERAFDDGSREIRTPSAV
jgi:hypothetical protein